MKQDPTFSGFTVPFFEATYTPGQQVAIDETVISFVGDLFF